MPAVASTRVNNIAQRARKLQDLLIAMRPVPEAWLGSPRSRRNRSPIDDLEPLYCNSYATLVNAWRKAMKWTDGLDCALSAMLSAAVSTNFVGEQLWFKVRGPASSGKTTILEGLAVNRKYVLSKDTIRGFHSGWKTEDGEDTSLVAMAKGKTLGTKDGDTLLKAPNLAQILSEARGIYDRVSRTHYRNDISTDYTGLRMTWILCGTSALREIDESELGQRFLDCVVMDQIDDEFEDAVGWRAANQEANNMLLEADGTAASQYPPELLEAMQLTGGYVGYLRENAVELYARVERGEDQLRRCSRLGKFVAFMRARPPRKQQTIESEREFSARLVKQMTRLALSEAVVLNKRSLDAEVMRRVHKIAFDTAQGIVLKIADKLFLADGTNGRPYGLEVPPIALYVNSTDDYIRSLMRFLSGIGVVTLYTPPTVAGVKSQPRRWILKDNIRSLYREVKFNA